MDTENNFDSDTSESWSFIDLNCDRSNDMNSTDEIAAEALEVRLEEVENNGKFSALPGDKRENGSSGNIITGNNGNIAPGNGRPKKQPLKVLYSGRLYEDESDSELYAPGGYGTSYLNCGGNVAPGTKEVDDDTDGISVISESEFNEGKVNAYESDGIWEEKPSDSDANENPSSNNLRKRKAPRVSSGESSGNNVNRAMGNEDSCSSNTDDERNRDGKQKKRPETLTAYIAVRNHRPSFAFRLTTAIIISGMSYIMLGHFFAEQDSFKAANNMAQTVKKLQKENFILHSRLTQLNRAVLARGINKLDLKEEIEPPCLKDDIDCEKINPKPYERNMDEEDYDFSHPRSKNSLDFSIPLNHPKNILAFKQILIGNEIVLAKKTDDTEESFNFSKYLDDILSNQNEETPPPPLGNDEEGTKPMEPGNEKSSEPKDQERGQKHEERKDEEPGEKHEEPKAEEPKKKELGKKHKEPKDKKPKGTNYGTGDGTRKPNCLAIQPKDLSEFRLFILKDKPKYTEIEIEDLEELGSNCASKIPIEKILHILFTDTSKHSNKAAGETNFFEGKDNEFIPSKTASASKGNSKSTHDRDNLKKKKPFGKEYLLKKVKNGEIKLTIGRQNFDYGSSSLKKKGKDEKGKLRKIYANKFLNYFEQVDREFKENKGRVKVCVKREDGTCDFKFKEPDENKKNGERKNTKKGQLPKLKKDNFWHKKWGCSFKPNMKCGNDSKCDDCSCKSGDWFSKYSEGREKCRRDQKISDWQFDRAKSREYSRMGDAFWQFSRADGRQNRRMYPHLLKKKAKRFSGKNADLQN